MGKCDKHMRTDTQPHWQLDRSLFGPSRSGDGLFKVTTKVSAPLNAVSVSSGSLYCCRHSITFAEVPSKYLSLSLTQSWSPLHTITYLAREDLVSGSYRVKCVLSGPSRWKINITEGQLCFYDHRTTWLRVDANLFISVSNFSEIYTFFNVKWYRVCLYVCDQRSSFLASTL